MDYKVRHRKPNKESNKIFNKRILDPIKTKASNNFKVYGFDVETTQTKDILKRKSGKIETVTPNNFELGSVVGKDYKNVFYDRKEMGDFLISRKFEGSLLFATNLEFDFNMLYYDRFKEFSSPLYKNRLLRIIKNEKYTRGKEKRNRTWTFLDTMNYMPTSLEELGKIVGLHKQEAPSFLGQKPKNYDQWQHLKDYNINDSTITYLYAEKLKEFCTQHNIKLKPTIASTGLDFWMRNYQQGRMIREKDEICDLHFQGAFRGGMTLVLKRGYYANRLWYYDYRSCYPARMRDGVDGKGSYPDPTSSEYTEKSTTEHIEIFEGICFAQVKAPYNYFPMLGLKNHDKKLLFPYGKYEGWFTNYELRIAMKNGYQVVPKQMVYYTSTFKPFRDAVLYLYNLRKQYKEKNHPFQAMVKILMNSGLFGKWGMNYLDMEDLILQENITYDKKGRAFLDGKEINGYSLRDINSAFEGFISVKKKCKPERYSMPILATYTTMLGRMKLWEDLNPVRDKLVYMDTDSAVVTSPCLKAGNELGDWELEHELESGIFIKPKFYAMTTRQGDEYFKLKGARLANKDHFMDVLKDKRVNIQKFTKMIESARMGIKTGTIINITKHLDLEDSKRKWLKKFSLNNWEDSKPLSMES